MATYIDINTPVISKITLPDGGTYFVADRELRDVVQDLKENLSGGIDFNIVWTAANFSSSTAPTAEVLATIPAGVTVYYNNGESAAVGTLPASADTKGIFYLVYSATQTSESDYFDEYASISSGTNTFTWEKIGDTMVDLSRIVQSITIGEETLTPDSTGDVDITWDVKYAVEEYLNETYIRTFIFEENGSEGNYVIKESVDGETGDPLTVSEFLNEFNTLSVGSYTISQMVPLEDGSLSSRSYQLSGSFAEATSEGTPGDTYVSKFINMSGSRIYIMSVELPSVIYNGGPNDNSQDIVTATLSSSWIITGASLSKVADDVLGEDTTFSIKSGTNSVIPDSVAPTSTFIKSVSAETGKNLVVTSITGVQEETTTASKAIQGTNQTTLSGSSTVSTVNTDWLKGITVDENGVLTFGAATLDTQTTTQYTFDDVDVPIKNNSSTTVATGSTSTTGTGSAIVTGITIGDTESAITSLPTMHINPTIIANNNDIVNVLESSTSLNLSVGVDESDSSSGNGAVVGRAIVGRSVIY